VVGDVERQVKKVAVLGGSGSRYVRHALFAGADVLITGDIDYHTAHDALAAGLAIIDPGHNVEKIMKRKVADYLRKTLSEHKYATEVIASRIDTEPFQFL
jgi:putative NIF3 family GTP cyclohydrolase 1 type 2